MSASFIFYVFVTRICSVPTPFAFFTVSGVSREQIRVTIIHLLYFYHNNHRAAKKEI